MAALAYMLAALILATATFRVSSSDTPAGLTNNECEKTIQPESCQYGRKFFGLGKYMSDNYTDVLKECFAACNESYVSYYEEAACEKGCTFEMASDKNRHAELTDYEIMGAQLIQQARLDQLYSHWMFEMLAGFDFLNNWYDAEDIDTEPIGSSYVIVSQSGDSIQFSSVKIYSDGNGVGSSESQRYSGLAEGTEPTNNTPLNPYRARSGVREGLEDDEEENTCSLAQYTWYAMCMLLLCSILGLLWLAFLTMVTSPKQKVAKKNALRRKLPLEFKPSKCSATVHGKKAIDIDDVELLQA